MPEVHEFWMVSFAFETLQTRGKIAKDTGKNAVKFFMVIYFQR